MGQMIKPHTTKDRMTNGTEKRLRQVIRDIDNGIGGGFVHAAWLSNSESMEASKYFVTGVRDDCNTLWYALAGQSIRGKCTVVGYSCESLPHRRYADIAESLEKHISETEVN